MQSWIVLIFMLEVTISSSLEMENLRGWQGPSEALHLSQTLPEEDLRRPLRTPEVLSFSPGNVSTGPSGQVPDSQQCQALQTPHLPSPHHIHTAKFPLYFLLLVSHEMVARFKLPFLPCFVLSCLPSPDVPSCPALSSLSFPTSFPAWGGGGSLALSPSYENS